MAAFFGVATVGLVYLAGSWAYGRKVGLLAAAFLALTVLAIQLSHSYVVDVVMVFWTTLFVVIGLRFMHGPSAGLYLSLMVVVGIAVATKFTAVFLFVPTSVALFLATVGRAQGQSLLGFFGRRGLELLGGLVIAAVTFLALTPAAVGSPMEYWWLDFGDPQWWQASNFPEGGHRLLWNLLLAGGAVRPLWSIASTPASQVMNPAAGLLLWGMGPFLLVMSGVGIVLAAKQRSKADWFLLSFLLASYLAVAASNVQFIRYVYPMVPVLAILAARLLVPALSHVSNQTWTKSIVSVALVVTLLSTALYSLAFTSIYRRPDTRLQAAAWIEHNIPAEATVGVDGPDLFVDPFIDPTLYRLHVLPIWRLYDESTQHTFRPGRPLSLIVGTRMTPSDNFGHLARQDMEVLVEQHLQSDYLVVSNRLMEQVEGISSGFDSVRGYYRALAEGRTDFQLVKTFRSLPELWGLSIDDSRAEHTFKIFDHPTILVYKRTTQWTTQTSGLP